MNMRKKNHVSCSLLFKIKLQSVRESPNSHLQFFFLEVVDYNILYTINYHLCLCPLTMVEMTTLSVMWHFAWERLFPWLRIPVGTPRATRVRTVMMPVTSVYRPSALSCCVLTAARREPGVMSGPASSPADYSYPHTPITGSAFCSQTAFIQ